MYLPVVVMQLFPKQLPFTAKGRLCFNIVRFSSRAAKQNDRNENDVAQMQSNERADKQLKVSSKVSDHSEVQVVSKHLDLHKSQRKSVGKQKPLVVLFQWLYAKPSTVNKYCALYHNIGLDVLTVRGKLTHFLWPPEGVKLSTELFDYLKANRPPDEKLLVHAFSVGAYNYTIAMQKAQEKQEDSGYFRDRVIGQIFDSIVVGTYENMSRGIAEVLPNNSAVRHTIIRLLDIYYNTTKKTTKETYESLVHHFKNEPIAVPTLIFSSLDDPMCDPVAMETMLSEWRSQRPNFEIANLTWPKSKHAAHLKEHKDEYEAAWATLMSRLQLLDKENKSK